MSNSVLAAPTPAPTAADPQSNPRSTVSLTAAPSGARHQIRLAALARLNMAPPSSTAVEPRSSAVELR
jgi:hypothetical protein